LENTILNTKFFIPDTRLKLVYRDRLINKLNQGIHRKLSLISAPAGFGKTTLVTEWLDKFLLNAEMDTQIKCCIAWLSLDENDNDPVRFLNYFIGALNKAEGIAETIGQKAMSILQSPQLPPAETILTLLINDIITIPDQIVFVLDDYHLIEAQSIHDALNFLLENLPSQMHMVIATRQDPPLPLGRLRARDQLTELRAADLRFTPDEAADFLKKVMGLDLSEEEVASLETRTEGWIAGLQLAAISMQGQDKSNFIQSFTGSHRFVLDYLVEEVLEQQPENVQEFLLRTSILNRLSSPLCDAVLDLPLSSGQETLEFLERANLFIVALDNERRWYRFHHLFAELLRQRLEQQKPDLVAKLHTRASVWYEKHGLEFEAFQHAASVNDVERAERLIAGDGIPRHLRGAVTTVLTWLQSLPRSTLNARPALWWRYATFLMFNGQTTGVDEKLQAAENALQGVELDDKTRNLIGQIAGTRAMLALTRYQVEDLLVQSRRALEYLDPKNLSSRASATLTLGFACFLQGDRTAARQAYLETIKLCQDCGNTFTAIMAANGLGNVLEIETHLHQAVETYQHALQLFGDQPLHTHAGQASLGLARISYEWNDLDAAEQYGEQSLEQVRQYDEVIDRFIFSEIFLARLKLAQGGVDDAAALLAQTERSARQRNFIHRLPEIAEMQVLILIRQGQVGAAAKLARQYELPLSQARVALAQGNAFAALSTLESYRQKMEAKGWADELLKVMILQSVALQAQGEKDKAMQVLGEALAMAESEGFIRIFVDEGSPMAQLLSEAALQGIMPSYVNKLLDAFDAEGQKKDVTSSKQLVDPLSNREIEILELIASGLKNKEIAEQLVISINTVLYHVKNIYRKLGVNKRTLAVAKAKEINLI